jgi:NADH-quinone oxidoreductase subunit I
MAIDTEQEVGAGAGGSSQKKAVFGVGLLKGLGVTLKHLLSRSITQQYPHVKPNLPPRSRGVIALKEANCTVCYKCSRECPDWCIYIDAHKETHEPVGGGRGRSVKVLDRFAIDYALCMYCGICVEVCPFDALFWSPEFEYAEYDVFELIHEKERLEEWTYKVLPPPALEIGAEPPEEEVEPPPLQGAESVQLVAPAAATPASPAGPTPAPAAAPVSGPPAVAEPAPAAVAEPGPAPPAASHGPAEHVEPDQETFDRILAEELAKGTDRRVAEGRARAAGVRAARKKAAG